MATKKATKKTASKSAKKAPGKAAKKGAKKVAKKVVKAARPGKKAKSVSVEGLQALRNDMKTLAEQPRPFGADEVGALAGRVHKEIETFLMACGGVGNGQSITKVSVIPSGGS
jgi:hypothetical protein